MRTPTRRGAATLALALGLALSPAMVGAAQAAEMPQRPGQSATSQKPAVNKGGVSELRRATSSYVRANTTLKSAIKIQEQINAAEAAGTLTDSQANRLEARRDMLAARALGLADTAEQYKQAAEDAHAKEEQRLFNLGREPVDSPTWINGEIAFEAATMAFEVTLDYADTIGTEIGSDIVAR